jgi:Ca2+-binding RTX toxin-like protein
VLGLLWPAASPAGHISIAANVTARLKERLSPRSWSVEVSWSATCQGAAAGADNYQGNLYLVDVDTGERIYLGGVSSATGKATQVVDARARERHMRPELQISCFESPSAHGSGTVVVTGDPLGGVVIIPPIFNDGRGAGGGGGDYGSGDPTEPQRPGGCTKALEGTSGPDSLVGGGAGDVIFGFGGNDRIKGAGGHDCLIGGQGDDVLRGEDGYDLLTGGRGDDTLIGGPGVNAYDAGPGKDYLDARNGRRELVRCGSGKDRARLDRRDRARGCERVNRV